MTEQAQGPAAAAAPHAAGRSLKRDIVDHKRRDVQHLEAVILLRPPTHSWARVSARTQGYDCRLTGSCDTTVGLLFVSQIFSKIARSPAALASLHAFSGTAANRRHDSLGKIPWVQKAETDAAPMSALSTRPHS